LFTFHSGISDIEVIAAEGDALFFPDHTEKPARIRRYYNGRVDTVFEIELKGANNASVNDIVIADGTGWAVGNREYPAGGDWRYEAFLIEYDGREWREVDITGRLPDGVPSGITPIDTVSFWFLFQERNLREREPWVLWKCDRGRFSEYPTIKGFKNNSHYELAVAYDLSSGVTYAAVAAKEECELFISEDRGASWVKENAKLNGHNTNLRPGSVALAATEGVLYVASNNYERGEEENENRYVGGAVHRRVGAPGCGEYELLLNCPRGPNFYLFRAVAVDDRGRVSAVGDWASAFFDGETFVLESLPNKNRFDDVTVGQGGFYAVAKHEAGFVEILYHP
jgi:hypothetical protein